MLGILDCTQTVFIAAGFRRECGEIYKMSLEFRGPYEKVCACMCCQYLVYLRVWPPHKDISPPSTEKNQTMSYFFRCCLWEITSEDPGFRNARLAQTTVQNRRQRSARRAVSLIQERSQLSPPRDSLRDWGIKKQTTPNTQHHQLRTRLNWKRNQTDGFGLETGVPLPSGLAHPDRHEDKEVGVSGDVCVWVRHVTQQTCSPECAK